MPLLLALLFAFPGFAASELEDARLSIRSLITPIIPGVKLKSTKPGGLRLDKCPREKINWMNVVMMKEEVTLNYKFLPGCDIQGSIKPKVFSPFPGELKLRNVPSYDKIISSNRITASLESKPILNLEMTSGVLSGKKSKVKFEATYQVRINPMTPHRVENDLGGELRITEINGKKVNIKEKILIK